MDEIVVDRLPPDEAFEELAHEMRLRILETLNEAVEPLAFTELRERVGVDDPGKFNYHLGKLTGRFVRGGEAGYELTGSGRQVVGAILSGGYTKRLDGEPLSTDAPCRNCDSEMTMTFRPYGIDVSCSNCGRKYTDSEVPAGIFEGRSSEEAISVVDRWLKGIQAMADYGFCHTCNGPLERTIDVVYEEAPSVERATRDPTASLYFHCERCGVDWYTAVEIAVLHHPLVAGFHYDHGIDVRETPPWDLEWIRSSVATVTSEDPLEVEIRIPLDDETLTLVFDENLNVVSERRA